MEISAINKFNIVTKSQNTVYPTTIANTMPDYVGENTKSKNNLLGLVALGALALAGVGYGVLNHRKVAGLNEKIAQQANDLKIANDKIAVNDGVIADLNSQLNKFKEVYCHIIINYIICNGKMYNCSQYHNPNKYIFQ